MYSNTFLLFNKIIKSNWFELPEIEKIGLTKSLSHEAIFFFPITSRDIRPIDYHLYLKFTQTREVLYLASYTSLDKAQDERIHLRNLMKIT